MSRIAVGVALVVGFAVGAAGAEPTRTWTLTNPTGLEYANELVRLKVEVPKDFDPAQWKVLVDGTETAAQVESAEGRTFLWVAADLSKGQKRTYVLEKGAPKSFSHRVKVKREKDIITLDNELTAVRVPCVWKEGMPVPPPVAAVRLPDGKWVGQGLWHAERRLTNFTAQVVGDGRLFGKVRLEYDFEGTAGVDNVPAHYRAEVSLPPDRRHVIIEEAYDMSRHSWWEFDAAHGWAPRQALTIPHFGGFGRKDQLDEAGNPYPFPPRSLQFGQTRMGDTLLNLVPRWSQAYDDGWFFLTHDGQNAVGATVCRAGQWLWPYDSMIEIKVKKSADYAGFRCPTRRGKRYWYLLAGPKDAWGDKAVCEGYVNRHSFETLDKIHQDYIVDWPGLQPPLDADGKPTVTPEEFCSGAGRLGRRNKPFFGWGPGGGHVGGEDHPITSLLRAQVYLDPDTFGDYWLFFSPENPNFASSWINGAYGAMKHAASFPGVTNHPSFQALGEALRMKAREEVYHSVTLPSGAGQECFGYMSRGTWSQHADVCKRLGFDAGTEPWLEAAARFIFRASHPMADGGRRSHPGGDTHPPGPDVFEGLAGFGLQEDVTALKTEELQGYGVIFRNHPGTSRETYLGFKSGPNRGHFHGDGLSFHYCAYGRPQAVDHHCSYAPRAGGEHMHNRVAFHTDTLPYANMDGYERLIAFRTSDAVDAAIGQVESDRIRITDKYPPESWDTELPQERFANPLTYRRTVVMVKGDKRDYFVFRDQYAGPDLYATYCLHAYGATCRQDHATFDFDPVRLVVAKPAAFNVSRHDWSHGNGGLEETIGLRLTVKGDNAEFITVLLPRPLRKSSVARLTLVDAVQRDERRDRAPQPVWKSYDLLALLTWDDGELQEKARFRTPVMDSRLSCGGTVKGSEEDGQTRFDLSASLSTRGFAAKVEYVVRVKREGDRFSGTYEEVLPADPAKKATREPKKGTVTGQWEKDVLPPLDLFAAAEYPSVTAIPGGVRVGEDEIVFAGGLDDKDETAYVTVKRGGKELLRLTGADVDMDRSQGEIGLFVPDAGYPFGDIPDWLIRQRAKRPSWYKDVWPPTK